MGSSEEVKYVKQEKPSSPAMAYYGPRLAVPPYFNSAVAGGHAQPMYIWGLPQSMMPPYGAPYAAFYANGGIYARPGVPLAGASFSTDTQAKSSANTDGGTVQKLKEFDGPAFLIGNCHTESAEGQVDQRVSQSEETEGSSDESNGITTGAGQNGKKRSRDGSPNNKDGKIETQNSMIPSTEVQCSEKTMDMIVPAVNTSKQLIGNVTTALELKYTYNTNVKSSPTSVPQSCPPMLNEACVQNDRELKRERRKQSNRDSARRSRLRKQAETEELAMRVNALTSEKMTLKFEIDKLMESSKKLKLENATLMEKLRSAQLGQSDETSQYEIDDLRMKPIGTINLLARVNNSGFVENKDDENDTCEKKSPRAKLHQLLDTSPRTDAVAAR
ncbi:common plant regulatory factor 1-like isoform X2 [Olea europaea var. sylvestris]|uniref:common plant regulatory factor 1-like isoform X2 n=1 Tax=Olea europaea var. sylvestris TaxID=158386 RepID=UPI000C1CDD2A|nr:common plant regulatory factor 1-like isoform X2 [Olea europaea var. sylvestris]